jgi:hypothetical protein
MGKAGWEVHQARRWEFVFGVFVDAFLLLCLLAEPAIISWGMGY